MSTVQVRNLRLALYILTGFAVGGLVALAVLPGVRERLFPGAASRPMGQALVGGPFTLTDHTGKRVTDQDFRGRFMLVFFGFTYCPDVCPTALQVMAAALEKLGRKAEQITPVLITVDPERDTPEQMAMYVKSFHPRLVGLTGTPAEIDGGRQGLSRLLQAGARSQVERRLHDGSFRHHLRYGTGRSVPDALSLHRRRRCHGGSARQAVALRAQPFNQPANQCSVRCTSV